MVDRESMSPFKLGLSVLWPTFWTSLPIKLALALVLLAMGTMHLETKLGVAFLLLLISPVSVLGYFVLSLGMDVHIGEGAGFACLLLLSIPVDIWALGLTARTIFLERLRVEPPESLGLSLWVRCAVAGAFYLPLLWFIVGQVTEVGRGIAASIFESEVAKHIPVAERISLELTLWGSLSTVVLIALVWGGFSIIGRFVRRLANTSRPAGEHYQALVSRWDLMRVPSDQPLMLGGFTAAGVALGILFWVFLPVSTPHPHECCKPAETKVESQLDPQKVLGKAEKVFKDSETRIASIEQQVEEEKGKDKDKGKGGKEKGGAKESSAKESKPQAEAKSAPQKTKP
jgi:hypothetical protein